MKHLTNLRFEIKSDKSSEWISIRADGPRHIWFVVGRDELSDVCKGKTRALEDGYHKLAIDGDWWTFYDMEGFPRERHGVMHVPYIRVHFPRTFMRAVYRLARKTWQRQHDARKGLDECEHWKVPEVRVDISPEHAAHIEELYGQGLGSVELNVTDGTTDFLNERLTDAVDKGDQTLFDMLDRVRCIAVNQTRGFHDTARVRLSKDWDGFFWEAYAPGRTRPFMHGGIVNHGAREGGHDWSIHT